MRALVVDDETPAREELTWLLGQCDDLEVVGQCATAAEAMDSLSRHRPDLVFLDVDMPGLNGVRLAQWLHDHLGSDAPLVVFVTAYENHAVEAFGLDAVDYLLKPVRLARLRTAVERARRRLAPAPLQQSPADHEFLERISVEELGSYRVIPVTEILWIEADEGFATVHTASGSHLTDFSLKFLEENLDPLSFFRCHRSFIVRLDAITRIEPWGAGTYRLLLSHGDDDFVPLARSRAPELKSRIPWSANSL
jgi:DNA-binding LytR/AlgR family response regulator